MKLPRWESLLLALCAAMTIGCGGAQRTGPAEVKKEEKAARGLVTVRGGKVYLADAKGRRQWEAQADLIEGDFLGGEGKMLGVKCTLLENERPVLTAQAGEAIYRRENRQVLLRGGVEAKWPDKDTKLNADEVTLALGEREVEARGRVRVVLPEGNLQGRTLRTDFALHSIELLDGGEKR